MYQREVLPYNPGTRDWVESTQSETPEAPTQSERPFTASLLFSGVAKGVPHGTPSAFRGIEGPLLSKAQRGFGFVPGPARAAWP